MSCTYLSGRRGRTLLPSPLPGFLGSLPGRPGPLPGRRGALGGLVLVLLGRGAVRSLARASSLRRRPSGGISGSMARSRIISAACGNFSGSVPSWASWIRAWVRRTCVWASAVALMRAVLRSLSARMISGSARPAEDAALMIRAAQAAAAASAVVLGLWANASAPATAWDRPSSPRTTPDISPRAMNGA